MYIKICGETLDPRETRITVGNVPIMLVISDPGEQISLVKCVRGHTFLGETYITVTP